MLATSMPGMPRPDKIGLGANRVLINNTYYNVIGNRFMFTIISNVAFTNIISNVIKGNYK